MKKWPLFGLLATVLACQSIPVDRAMSAERGNAATLLLCGLGDGCGKGNLFTQVQEGSGGSGVITLKTLESTNCNRESCVRFQVFQPDGSQGYSGGIPKGESEAHITLSQLIQSEDGLKRHHDGEYLIKAKLWFEIDDDERSAIAWGFVRVVVVDSQYQFLGFNDPESAWTVRLKPQCVGQYTTGLRSAIQGKCDE